jgi:hypothetical protein
VRSQYIGLRNDVSIPVIVLGVLHPSSLRRKNRGSRWMELLPMRSFARWTGARPERFDGAMTGRKNNTTAIRKSPIVGI